MMRGAGPYAVMPRAVLGRDGVTLRAVEPEHIELIRQWRNAQMDVLRQIEPISPAGQRAYFEAHIWPDKPSPTPANILLAIERDGAFVGYGGLVHISWVNRRAEISFLLDPVLEAQPDPRARILALYLELIQELAFNELGLNRLSTETFAFRSPTIAGIEASGMVFEGRLRQHAIIDQRPTDALVHGLLAVEWKRRHTGTRASGIAQSLAPLTVLVTSSSRKAPLIRAMKQAASRLDSCACVVAGDLDPAAPARFVADAFWPMPRCEADAVEGLLKGCKARGISIVLPTRDGELAFWAQHAARFAAAGIAVIVSPPEGVARCLDKLAFYDFARRRGLPVIPASVTLEPLETDRLVVKERFGAGSRAIGLDLSPDGARAYAATLSAPLFQPFVPGPEISIDAWLDADGRTLGVVPRRRDRVAAGESQVTTTFRDRAIEVEAITTLDQLGLRGPVVMQAIVVDGGLRIIEVNPRFGGASTAAIAAGLDSLYWSLAETLGEVHRLVFSGVEGSVCQVRLPADIVVHDTDL